MTLGRTISGLTLAAIGCLASVAAGATEPEAMGAGDQMFGFSVCNRTAKEVSVAISHRLAPSSRDFVVAGWWKVAARGCRKIGSYPRGHFYMHAQSGGSTWGKGDITLCVETPGPFKRISLPNYKCNGPLLRKFSHVDVKSASWEWTLNP